MLARRLCSVIVQTFNELACHRNNSYFLIQARTYGIDHEKRQYELRKKEQDFHESKITDDPEKPKNFLWFSTTAPSKYNFFLGNIKAWLHHQKSLRMKFDQAFVPERHEKFGVNLAAAYFIISRGGKVRFKDSIHWMHVNEQKFPKLPEKHDPLSTLEAIDVNGYDLHYEGLSNLCGLTSLKWLSLKNCKNIDDWSVDKFSSKYPILEYLDISGCEKITERGLESLYRMPRLKTLIVTNYYKSVAFELTCLMLEDCIPGLVCNIHVPKEKLEKEM